VVGVLFDDSVPEIHQVCFIAPPHVVQRPADGDVLTSILFVHVVFQTRHKCFAGFFNFLVVIRVVSVQCVLGLVFECLDGSVLVKHVFVNRISQICDVFVEPAHHFGGVILDVG